MVVGQIYLLDRQTQRIRQRKPNNNVSTTSVVLGCSTSNARGCHGNLGALVM